MTLWAHCIPFTTNSGPASTNTAIRKRLRWNCSTGASRSNGKRPFTRNFYPKFATIERYFYDTDKREILTADGKPFLDRQMGAGELARAPEKSCFK